MENDKDGDGKLSYDEFEAIVNEKNSDLASKLTFVNI